ncbi:cupin domain-containing protein [Paraburkholderia sp. J94]|uniref:cupin domain-containing protein n=1 Tax=Paraburkholderia sp. J94 TaxID=2805441 RepID=UPI002AAF1786|nr:cupin domain-containing protein [Paraburkholderia sp. J94]
MSKLIHDVKELGAGLGDYTKLDYGMDEGDWRGAEGQSGNYVVGWWEGKVGSVEFPATGADEAVWLVEGKIALTDVNGGRKEFTAGQGYLLPAGFAGRWETVEDAKKFYVLLEPQQ